jgi:hypothetical protein
VAERVTTAAGGGETFDAAHARLIETSAIQFDMPAHRPPEPPAWLEPLINLLRLLEPALKYLFWGAVVIGLAVIAMLILDELTGTRWRFWRARPADHGGDARLATRANRGARASRRSRRVRGPRRLCRRGAPPPRAKRRGPERPAAGRAAPSSTARELARSDLPEAARRALARIVRGVEISLFGGAALGEPVWRECRRAYEEFAFESHWQ